MDQKRGVTLILDGKPNGKDTHICKGIMDGAIGKKDKKNVVTMLTYFSNKFSWIATRSAAFRHLNTASAAFFDGHTESLDLLEHMDTQTHRERFFTIKGT